METTHRISDFILDQNNQYIVAIKPGGMPAVPDKSGDSNLKNILEAYSKHDLHVITRIDRPVSGLCLFAKSKKSAQALSEQLVQQKIDKSYIAIVEKKPEHIEGELINYLIKGRNNKALISDSDQKKAKKAILTYATVTSLDNYTILKIALQTGRFHQIRSQLAHMGCPIKGDVKYGARRKNKDRSIHLHAYELSFTHPTSLEKKNYTNLPPHEDSLWKIACQFLEK